MITVTSGRISLTSRWLLASALLLMAGAPFAQAETTEPNSCPHAAADGTCPHATHGKGMHGHPGGHGGPMAMFENMGDELALTDAQKQEMAALLQIYGPRMKELAERGADSRRAFMGMAPDDPGYNIEADKLGQQAGASATELVALLTELQTNAYALLTPEQQAKYMALRTEQMQRMEQRKAEMQARREAGEPAYGPGYWRGHGAGKHQCKACKWLEDDDNAKESAEMEALEDQEIGF